MQPTTRVLVTVTFLRMDSPPTWPAPAFPPGALLERVVAPTVALYRTLYNAVGEPHLWWLRRAMPDSALAPILADPAVSLHVLTWQGGPAGFFELDGRARPDVNLSYFGLMPHAVGQGLGTAFLRAAVDEAFGTSLRGVTVNTCTADHQRALPTYLRLGFRPVRSVREVWDVPNCLGMTIPAHLRAE